MDYSDSDTESEPTQEVFCVRKFLSQHISEIKKNLTINLIQSSDKRGKSVLYNFVCLHDIEKIKLILSFIISEDKNLLKKEKESYGSESIPCYFVKNSNLEVVTYLYEYYKQNFPMFFDLNKFQGLKVFKYIFFNKNEKIVQYLFEQFEKDQPEYLQRIDYEIFSDVCNNVFEKDRPDCLPIILDKQDDVQNLKVFKYILTKIIIKNPKFFDDYRCLEIFLNFTMKNLEILKFSLKTLKLHSFDKLKEIFSHKIMQNAMVCEDIEVVKYCFDFFKTVCPHLFTKDHASFLLKSIDEHHPNENKKVIKYIFEQILVNYPNLLKEISEKWYHQFDHKYIIQSYLDLYIHQKRGWYEKYGKKRRAEKILKNIKKIHPELLPEFLKMEEFSFLIDSKSN